MTSFRRLAAAATAATFCQIAVGGLVRATKSGLGCGDDWPHCSGRLLPALQTRAEVIEFSHRLFATLVIVLVGMLAWRAWRAFGDRPRLVRAALGAFALVLWQALLGAIVVWLHLEALSVVLHLATALVLAGILVYLWLAGVLLEGRASPPAHPGLARNMRLAAGAVFALLLVGSYVSGRDAGYVFPDWPLMNGALVPDLSHELFAIHFLHRAMAALVGVLVAWACLRVIARKAAAPGAARLAHAALGLFALEVLIGAFNVWTALNSAVVTAHLATGALIWGALVAGTLVLDPAVLARAAAPRRAGEPAPAVLEAGG